MSRRKGKEGKSHTKELKKTGSGCYMQTKEEAPRRGAVGPIRSFLKGVAQDNKARGSSAWNRGIWKVKKGCEKCCHIGEKPLKRKKTM